MSLSPIFSSDDVPADERTDLWGESFARNIFGHEFRHTDPRPFRARVAGAKLGPVFLANLELTAGDYVRSRACLTDGNDNFGFFISRSGGVRLNQGQSATALARSEATLLDLTVDGATLLRPEEHPGESHHFTCIHLPRQAVLGKVPKAERLELPRFVGSERLRLLLAYLDLLQTETATDPALAELTGRHLLELAALTLGGNPAGDREAQRHAVRAGRHAAVRQAIDAHYREDDFTARACAAMLGISERYVHELMADQGLGFSDAVNRLRLDEAARLLAEPGNCRCRIADIAFAVGFSDISYFNRLFRRRFGETPRDFRAGRPESARLPAPESQRPE